MSLIKCNECGKEISDKAKKCPNCGYSIKKESKSYCKECGNKLAKNEEKCNKCGCPIKKKITIKQIMIISLIVIVCVVFVIIGNKLLNNNKLVCSFQTTNNVGILDYKITYTFSKDGSIKNLKGYQYTKPTDSEVAEYLWKITNNQQEQYNYYDGMSYKATYSEDKEITLDYSVDAKKAPKMFEAVTSMSGIEGITSSKTKEEIKKIFEENNYTCK